MESTSIATENGGARRLVLLRPEEAAKLLQVSRGTLDVWRSTKRYPLRYVKVGGKIRYRLEHIQEFLELRTHSGDGEPRSNRRRRSRAN